MDHLSLMDILRRYPMMSNHQVIIMKEAQQFRSFEKLTAYFENPLPSTVFVICHKYKKLDQRTSLAKLIASKAIVYTSKSLYENQVPQFVSSIMDKADRKISHHASVLLTEYLGNDLSKIEGELEKLALNVSNRETISPEHIEKYIGISKDYNVFELTKALVLKDSKKAFRIVNYFINNPKPNPPIKIIGALNSFFSKAYVVMASKYVPQKEMMSALRLYPMMMNDLNAFQERYSVQEAMHIMEVLQEYDLKSKGVNYSGSGKNELLKELVYKILNPVPETHTVL